ncbi:hypothetical protein Dimus_008378 [Dionaea muscipula]
MAHLDIFLFRKKHLKRKLKKLKVDSNEYVEAPTSAINQMDEELENIKADVDMLNLDNVSLEKWNGELTKRNVELTSDLKSTSDECDTLKRQLKVMEEENERLRDEMKVTSNSLTYKKFQLKTALASVDVIRNFVQMGRDEAHLKAHQFDEKLTKEKLERWKSQNERITNENAALRTAQKGMQRVLSQLQTESFELINLRAEHWDLKKLCD